MVGATTEEIRDSQLLSAAIKLVRRSRRMSTRQVAAAMNMSVRTYQRFEAGASRLNPDHIHRFAKATASDPYGIIMAIMIGSPRLALNSADNMLATILVIGVQNLDQSLGDRIAELDTRSMVGAVTTLFDGLAEQVLRNDPAKTWLTEGRDALSARRPRPGR